MLRRDSPNGKRYARKGRGGELQFAFGFDLSPLVARAEEFEGLAAEIEAEARAVKLARERITLCRRDIAKMIATGIEEGVQTRREGQGPASWQDAHTAFRAILEGLPRAATRQQLEEAAETLSQLADDIRILLETQVKTTNMSGNESQNERHIQNSKPEPLIDLEPASERSGAGEPIVLHPELKRAGETVFPLGMVLDACPDIADYSRGGISNWRDLVAAASVVRSALGVSPSAWEEAQTILGESPRQSSSPRSSNAERQSRAREATCENSPARRSRMPSRSGLCSWRSSPPDKRRARSLLVSNRKYGNCLSSCRRFLVIQLIPKCHFSLTWLLSPSCGCLSVPSQSRARSICDQEPIVNNEAAHDGFRSEGNPTVISSSRASSAAATPNRSQTLGDRRHRSPPEAHFESDSQSLSPDTATLAFGWRERQAGGWVTMPLGQGSLPSPHLDGPDQCTRSLERRSA